MEKLLEMKEICKSFGTNNVLKNVQFDLFAGEVHALIGENGAGKTTLLNILAGIRLDYKGESLISDSILINRRKTREILKTA